MLGQSNFDRKTEIKADCLKSLADKRAVLAEFKGARSKRQEVSIGKDMIVEKAKLCL